MKKKFIKVILLIAVLLLILFGIFFFNEEKQLSKEPDEELKETENIVKVEGVTNSNCDSNKEFYLEKNGIRYYLVCLNTVKVNINKNEYTLKEALENKYINMDLLISKMSNGEAIPTISSTLYKSKEDDIKNLSIIHCNTQKGNIDYYIGDNSLEYKEGYCDRTCNFTRTYHILSVVANDDTNYYNVTLTTYDGKDLETVKVKKELMEKYKMNEAYEFTFRKDELDYIEDDSIKKLFNTFVVSKIEKTDKQKENQIQDKICKIK